MSVGSCSWIGRFETFLTCYSVFVSNMIDHLDFRLSLIRQCQKQLSALDLSVRQHESAILDNFLVDDLELLDELFVEMRSNAALYFSNIAAIDETLGILPSRVNLLEAPEKGWLLSTLPLYWKIGSIDIADGLMKTLGAEFLREAEYKVGVYVLVDFSCPRCLYMFCVDDLFNR